MGCEGAGLERGVGAGAGVGADPGCADGGLSERGRDGAGAGLGAGRDGAGRLFGLAPGLRGLAVLVSGPALRPLFAFGAGPPFVAGATPGPRNAAARGVAATLGLP